MTSGDSRAKTSVDKLNTWLRTSTSGDVSKISNGYQLDGTAIYKWSDATFLAPFAVGAMSDLGNQAWLNSLYSEVVSAKISDGDYYSNTIKLLSMMTISGNYWNPKL